MSTGEITVAAAVAHIVSTCRLVGYRIAPTGDEHGFADLTLVLPGSAARRGLVRFVTLIASNDEATDERLEWLATLREAGARADLVHVDDLPSFLVQLADDATIR